MKTDKNILKLEEKIRLLTLELTDVKRVLSSALEMLDKLSAENEFQRKEIARLKSQLLKTAGKSVTRTSKNSDLPPSKDKFRPERRRSQRVKSERKSGGQTGHKGTTLELVTVPDEEEHLYADHCESCGKKLEKSLGYLNSIRQQIDIPLIKPHVKQFNQYSHVCDCGCISRGKYPYGINSRVQYGPKVRSLITYLSVRQYIPYQRMQEFLGDCFSIKLSEGTIYNTLERTSKKTKGIYESLKDYLSQSNWLGSDETGIYVNGKNWYSWVWQNKSATYIIAAPSKRKDHISETFYHGFPSAILSSDQYSAQVGTPALGHQICYAHLYRRLIYLMESEPSVWLEEVRSLLKGAEKLKKEKSERARSDPAAEDLESKLNRLLLDPIIKKETRTFQKSLLKHRHAIFTFLYYNTVPSDNNSSEQAIRNFKVKMKVSGFFKSQQHTYAQLRSITDTLLKNGKSILSTFQLVEQGKDISLGW